MLRSFVLLMVAVLLLAVVFPAIACDQCRGGPGIQAAFGHGIQSPVMALEANPTIVLLQADAANVAYTSVAAPGSITDLLVVPRARDVEGSSLRVACSNCTGQRPDGEGSILLRQGGLV